MSNLEMRQVVSNVLEEMMAKDDRIVVLDADLAKAVGTAGLHKKFPERAYNLGIAEANMTSVAAGLASYGFIPLTFTFATFATRRVCDQIAQSIAFAKSNVKMFGGDPGVTAQINGATHMAIEDIGVLRSIPDLMIWEPSDATMMTDMLPKIINHNGPVYIRLLRKQATSVYPEGTTFDMFKIHEVQDGTDITLASSGIMLGATMEAAEALKAEGYSVKVLDVHTIKPFDTETMVAALQKTGCVVSIENHNVIGGLGSAIAETSAKHCPVPIEFIGIQDHFGQAADQGYLLEKFKMTPKDIIEAAKKALNRKG